jgi:hypothetical protein
MRVIFLLFFVIKTIVFQNLESHGFPPNTPLLKKADCCDGAYNCKETTFYQLVEQRESLFDWMPKIITYDVERKHKQLSNITVIGKGTSNCIVRIVVHVKTYNKKTQQYEYSDGQDIDCSPIQQIYVKGKGFIDAYLLKKEDELENFYNKKIVVKYVKLIKGNFDLCAFTLEKNHTFYVGYSGILTHNFALNLGIGFAFDQGLGASGLSWIAGLEPLFSVGVGFGIVAIKYGYDYFTKTATYAMEATQQCYNVFEKALNSDVDFLNTPVSQVIHQYSSYQDSVSSNVNPATLGIGPNGEIIVFPGPRDEEEDTRLTSLITPIPSDDQIPSDVFYDPIPELKPLDNITLVPQFDKPTAYINVSLPKEALEGLVYTHDGKKKRPKQDKEKDKNLVKNQEKKEEEKPRGKGDNRHVTNDQVRTEAREQGLLETKKHKFNSHGQLVFEGNGKFYSLDVDSHRGAYWKVTDKDGNRYPEEKKKEGKNE